MTSRAVDLVIVGASFAGLICARTAALRGLSTVVIEAKPEELRVFLDVGENQ